MRSYPVTIKKNYSDKYFGTDDITANYILQEANERLIALGVKPVKESYYFQSRKTRLRKMQLFTY